MIAFVTSTGTNPPFFAVWLMGYYSCTSVLEIYLFYLQAASLLLVIAEKCITPVVHIICSELSDQR